MKPDHAYRVDPRLGDFDRRVRHDLSTLLGRKLGRLAKCQVVGTNSVFPYLSRAAERASAHKHGLLDRWQRKREESLFTNQLNILNFLLPFDDALHSVERTKRGAVWALDSKLLVLARLGPAGHPVFLDALVAATGLVDLGARRVEIKTLIISEVEGAQAPSAGHRGAVRLLHLDGHLPLHQLLRLRSFEQLDCQAVPRVGFVDGSAPAGQYLTNLRRWYLAAQVLARGADPLAGRVRGSVGKLPVDRFVRYVDARHGAARSRTLAEQEARSRNGGVCRVAPRSLLPFFSLLHALAVPVLARSLHLCRFFADVQQGSANLRVVPVVPEQSCACNHAQDRQALHQIQLGRRESDPALAAAVDLLQIVRQSGGQVCGVGALRREQADVELAHLRQARTQVRGKFSSNTNNLVECVKHPVLVTWRMPPGRSRTALPRLVLFLHSGRVQRVVCRLLAPAEIPDVERRGAEIAVVRGEKFQRRHPTRVRWGLGDLRHRIIQVLQRGKR